MVAEHTKSLVRSCTRASLPPTSSRPLNLLLERRTPGERNCTSLLSSYAPRPTCLSRHRLCPARKARAKASASAASGIATDQATVPPIHIPHPSTSAALAPTDLSSEAKNDNDNTRSEDVDEDQDQDQDDEGEGEEPARGQELRKDAKGLEGKAQVDDAFEED